MTNSERNYPRLHFDWILLKAENLKQSLVVTSQQSHLFLCVVSQQNEQIRFCVCVCVKMHLWNLAKLKWSLYPLNL